MESDSSCRISSFFKILVLSPFPPESFLDFYPTVHLFLSLPPDLLYSQCFLMCYSSHGVHQLQNFCLVPFHNFNLFGKVVLLYIYFISEFSCSSLNFFIKAILNSQILTFPDLSLVAGEVLFYFCDSHSPDFSWSLMTYL